MAQVPVYFAHEEDFTWIPGMVDNEDTVEQAAQKLAQHVIGLRVEPRSRSLGIALMEDSASQARVLAPELQVKQAIAPLSLLKLMWT